MPLSRKRLSKHGKLVTVGDSRRMIQESLDDSRHSYECLKISELKARRKKRGCHIPCLFMSNNTKCSTQLCRRGLYQVRSQRFQKSNFKIKSTWEDVFKLRHFLASHIFLINFQNHLHSAGSFGECVSAPRPSLPRGKQQLECLRPSP